MSGVIGIQRPWVAVAVGLVWAQCAIAVRVFVLPGYVALAEPVVDGRAFRMAWWTLLAPLALASRFTSVPGVPHDVVSQPSLAALLLGPLLAVGLCLVVARLLDMPRWRSWTGLCLAMLGLVCAASTSVVVHQLRDAVIAERTFFAMVSQVDVAHRDPGTVSAAREFVRRHPDSRWAGEALRIEAMAEWDAGRFESAADLWGRFGSRFRDRTAPGVAYAEYSIALCDERLGRRRAASEHLRAAIEIIRARGDGIQAWIAVDAARRLSALARTGGRLALAGYWTTKSQTFSDVYSIE